MDNIPVVPESCYKIRYDSEEVEVFLNLEACEAHFPTIFRATTVFALGGGTKEHPKITIWWFLATFKFDPDTFNEIIEECGSENGIAGKFILPSPFSTSGSLTWCMNMWRRRCLGLR